MRVVRHLCAALFSCCLVSISQAAPYSYATHQLQLTDLGAGVNPTAINNVGQVVGQAANSQAFWWASGTTTPLGTLGGTQSYANDINDNGVAVGWSHDSAGKQKAFKYDGSMTNLDAAVTFGSAAEAVNALGDIVGWRTDGTHYASTLWNDINPGGQFLFTNETVNHKAQGINDNGMMVGITMDESGGLVASYYWDGQTVGGFNHIIADDYFPIAGINNGLFTAGSFFANASILTIGSHNPLQLDKLSPTDPFAAAYGLNDLNQVVGTSGDKAFLYDQPLNSLLNINLFPRLTLGFGQVLRLNEINNDGTFVGVALVDGVEHGIVGQLVVPEPSGFALAAVALSVFILGIRRKRDALAHYDLKVFEK